MNLTLCFAGTPVFARDILQFLIDQSCNIQAVYTQADKPAGRGQKITESPVKILAQQHGCPIQQPKSLKTTDAIDTFAGFKPDVLIVVAYGLLLPPPILAIPKYGCINIHASLLPRWRGAAPIQRAIEAGDEETGVSIMQMDAGLDTGDVLRTQSCAIARDETSQTLHDKLIPIAQAALWETLKQLAQDALHPEQPRTLHPKPQNNAHANYAHKIEKAEAEIDWTQPAVVIERKIRAFNPWPVAHSRFAISQPIRILSAEVDDASVPPSPPGTVFSIQADGIRVAAGEGSCLKITEIQLPGKPRQAVKDLIHGHSLQTAFFGGA